MKWSIRLLIVTILTLTSLGSVNLALAQDGPLPAEKLARDGAFQGQVTVVSDTSLTVKASNGQEITASVADDTKVHVVGSGPGSLSDVKVGDFVGIRGLKGDDNRVQARMIIVFPGDPNNLGKVQGKVTAIEDKTIVVQNQQGSQRIITTADTRFRFGRDKQQASLDDIEPDQFVLAVGTRSDDAPLVARLVVAVSSEQLRKHVLQGQVVSVDTDAGTLMVNARNDKQGTWTIQTTDQTKYRIPNADNPTLADVPEGALVAVAGTPAEDDSQSGTARLVIVLPKKALGQAAGEVTVLNKDGFSLQSLNRGELKILTDESTQYRTRGQQDVSADDIGIGSKVAVVGQPVAGQVDTIRAKTVGIKIEPTQK